MVVDRNLSLKDKPKKVKGSPKTVDPKPYSRGVDSQQEAQQSCTWKSCGVGVKEAELIPLTLVFSDKVMSQNPATIGTLSHSWYSWMFIFPVIW